MTYAYLTDGLDLERREQFDQMLAEGGGDEKAVARREREAMQQMMTRMQTRR